MPRRVIRGATIMPLEGRRLVRQSDLLIEDGIIAAIGGVDTEGAMITDVRGVVLPGLVQAHVHLSETLLDRHFVPHTDPNFYEEVQLVGWRDDLDEQAAHVQAHAGLARGLNAGSVCFADASPSPDPLAGAAAASTIGVRLVVGIDATRPGAEQRLEVARSRLAPVQHDGLITFALWAGRAERCPRSQLTRAAQLARSEKLPLFVHMGVLPKDQNGFARLERAGALIPELVICHASGTSLCKAAQFRALKDAEATVVLTPAFDLLRGAPPPPVPALLEAGVRLALGSDTGATRLGFDPFREARLLAAMLKDHVEHPASVALEIATRGGGRGLGIPTGSVEVKQAADLLLIDVDPAGADDHESLAARVLDRASPQTIRNVWINGNVVLSDGRVARGDPPSEATEESIRARLGYAVERRVHKGATLGYVLREVLSRPARMRRGWHRGRLVL